MNGNTEDNTPLQPWTDPELEARVVALVLGEASDFEREEIERHLAEQPELRLFKERIEEVHALLRGREEQEDWRLSEARRGKLLAALSSKSKSKSTSPSRSNPKVPWWIHPGFRIAATVVILGAVSSILIGLGTYHLGSVDATVAVSDAEGLHAGDNVFYMGERIGSVTSIEKTESGADLNLSLFGRSTLPENIEARVGRNGLMGDTFVGLGHTSSSRAPAAPSAPVPVGGKTSPLGSGGFLTAASPDPSSPVPVPAQSSVDDSPLPAAPTGERGVAPSGGNDLLFRADGYDKQSDAPGSEMVRSFDLASGASSLPDGGAAKVGAGTLTLQETNTYTGGTIIPDSSGASPPAGPPTQAGEVSELMKTLRAGAPGPARRAVPLGRRVAEAEESRFGAQDSLSALDGNGTPSAPALPSPPPASAPAPAEPMVAADGFADVPSPVAPSGGSNTSFGFSEATLDRSEIRKTAKPVAPVQPMQPQVPGLESKPEPEPVRPSGAPNTEMPLFATRRNEADIAEELKAKPNLTASSTSGAGTIVLGGETSRIDPPPKLPDAPEAAAASPETSVPEAARKAVARRQVTVAQADEAALRGERLLAEEDYDGAVRELKRSLDLLPDTPVVDSRRKENAEQLADAGVLRARQLAEEGRFSEAMNTLETVLDPAVSPENAAAKQLLADLNDPEIYPQATTPEHIARVKKVESAVQEAASSIRIGDYDAAEQRYHEALKYDPYNSAARRGLEDVEKHRRMYLDSAYDQTRSTFLRQIESQWEQSASGLQMNGREPVELSAQTFSVPPALLADFAKRSAANLGDSFGASLPTTSPQTGKEILESVGVTFPPDTDATYNSLTGELTVRNTQANLDLVAAFVESITPPPPPASLEIDSATEPFSTFSLHVSDVSFQLAQAALAKNEWPEKESVRIEEFVNAFDYGDPSPDEAEPVACRIEQAAHPFLQQRNLLRFGIRTASTGRGASSPLRLTLLLDRSGSMERPDRQETVQRALEQLAAEMRDGDELTVIAFARQPRLVVDRANREAAAQLPADLAAIPTEGGTNLEAALDLAAQKARATKTPGAQNRIVLLTDGAANLGDANPDRLAERIHALRQEGIAFDAAGIGADGLNDTILEALTRKGDGRYYLLNGPEDAGEGFARKLAGAFRPGAKDVKVQIQFNPDRVGRYRLLGFEEHRLKKEEFRDDTVDAAELASEEAGVAVYQVEVKPDGSGDVGFVSVRFLDVASGERVERRWLIPIEPKTPGFDQAPPSLQLAGLAAWTAAKLKDDPAAASTDWTALSRIHTGLPEAWTSGPRVRALGEMLSVAGALARE